MKKYSMILFCSIFINVAVYPQSEDINSSPISIKSFLNPDGTINRNTRVQGSLDMKGWRMQLKNNGEPQFIRNETHAEQVLADTAWSDQFSVAGLDGAVFALAYSNGNLYAGGDFHTAGGIIVNHIAKWDGTRWSALGSGLDDYVKSIATMGDTVYVAGNFTQAGGTFIGYFGKWDGHSWSSISGFGGYFPHLIKSGSYIYVYGSIGFWGDTSKTGIARWDGLSWSALGGGIQSPEYPEYATAVNETVYVAVRTSSPMVHNFKKWDGTSWTNLPGEINGDIHALAANGRDFYITGSFDSVGNTKAKNIAHWDGNNWLPVGDNTYNGFGVMSFQNNNLICYGYINGYSGVYRWDGSSWSNIDPQNINWTDAINSICVVGTNIYVGGSLHAPPSVNADWITKWDGNKWQAIENSGIHNGANGYVNALAFVGNDLYVGGAFTKIGNANIKCIAKWDGAQWTEIGGGVNDGISSFCVKGNDLYVGGEFTLAGGTSANRIVRWDGLAWHSLGSGMNKSVCAIAIVGNDLYAGGTFTSAGSVSANYIARWDGMQWHNLGSGVSGFNGWGTSVSCIEGDNHNIYVGGDFKMAGNVRSNCIAKWDGTNWSAMGSGLYGSSYTNSYPVVFAIAVHDTDVYIGGSFMRTYDLSPGLNGIAVWNIARWDGSRWFPLGDGIVSSPNNGAFVSTIILDKCYNLYASGSFNAIGDLRPNNIAMWDGHSWSQLGSGLDYKANTFALHDSSFYVGGNFRMAGSKPSSCIAKWTIHANPKMAISQNPIYFDLTYPGYSCNKYLDISNIGNGYLYLHVNSSNSVFKSDTSDYSIAACTVGRIALIFTPQDSGMVASTVTIMTNDITQPNVTIPIYGYSIHSPSINTDIDTIRVGPIETDTVSRVFKVKNGGLGNLACVVAPTAHLLQVAKKKEPAKTMNNICVASNISRPTPKCESIKRVLTSNNTIISSKILLLEDNAPWGSCADDDILQWMHYSYEWYPSSKLDTLNLSPYKLILIAGDQTTLFYSTIANNQTKLNQFVSNGGVLEFHGAGWGWNGGNASLVLLPGGVGINYWADSKNTVIQSFHPIADGLSHELLWSYASHGYFSNLLPSTNIIMTDTLSHPTLIEYQYGKGRVIASGQPVEHAYTYFAPWYSLLQNLVNYSYSIASTFWIASSPSFFHVAPHDSQTVVLEFNANKLPGGDNAVDMMIYSNDPLNGKKIISTHLLIPSLNVNQGWNIISVPKRVKDFSKTILFPHAISDAFLYQGSYVSRETLCTGTGYWLKSGQPEAVPMIGTGINSDTIPVIEGWNLIGSLTEPINIASIITEPDNLISSQLFAYNNSYTTADTIYPGRGYWIKVNMNGNLILNVNSSANSSMKNRIKIQNSSELPPPPPGGNLSEVNLMPQTFALQQAYPNPFNPITKIQYALPIDAKVKLVIYNTLGQQVATLVDQIINAGYQSVEWNASDLASGVYFYHLEATGVGNTEKAFTKIMKMIVIK